MFSATQADGAGHRSRPTRSSRSTSSACRSRRSASCRATPIAATGFGSAGSRSLFVGGSAVHVGRGGNDRQGARASRREALEAAAGDIEYATASSASPAPTVASACSTLAATPAGPAHRCSSSTSAVAGPTWPNGCHICEVEIDPDTGDVEIVAYSSVNDVGRVVNPMIVSGPARRRRGAGHRPGAVRARASTTANPASR